MPSYAIVGAGYGDEGKGLITDYLARKLGNGTINVRCNGGAQAGHTVVDPGNQYHGFRRHVFSHIGAGTFAGAQTWLSSRFIVNPFVMHQEMEQLYRQQVHPNVEIHPEAQVTTVFDTVLNGLKELSRGVNRHGSCCLGINETVTRSLAGFPLTMEDLISHLGVYKKMTVIYHEYWRPLIEPFEKSEDPEVKKLLSVLDLQREIENLRRAPPMFTKIVRKPSCHINNVIFEMAQGLALDEFLGEFPHVTRSITGLPSAILAASEIGVDEITPVYVTRCYKTRHGAGPLPYEGEHITSVPLTDATNITGQWQGQFRYAPLDIKLLNYIIQQDLKRSESIAQLLRVHINPHQIAVTCLDQVDDLNYYRGQYSVYGVNELIKKHGVDGLINDLENIGQVKYLGYGPTAEDVKEA